jgi:hypothetical protein
VTLGGYSTLERSLRTAVHAASIDNIEEVEMEKEAMR